MVKVVRGVHKHLQEVNRYRVSLHSLSEEFAEVNTYPHYLEQTRFVRFEGSIKNLNIELNLFKIICTIMMISFTIKLVTQQTLITKHRQNSFNIF